MFGNVRMIYGQVFENLRKCSKNCGKSSENRHKRRHLYVFTFFFSFFLFYCLTYTTYIMILTLPTLLTLIKTLTPITLLTLRYITVLNTTLAKKVFTEYFHFCLNITFFFRKQSFALLILLCLHHLNFLSFFFFKYTRTIHTNTNKPVKYTRLPLQALH